MRSQHATTAAQLERLDALLPAWETAADATARDHVADLLDEIRTTLLAHLGQEETRSCRPPRAVMSQREWSLLHEHGMASIPKDKLLAAARLDPGDHPRRRARRVAPHEPARAGAGCCGRSVGKRQFAAHRARIYGR